MIQKIAALPSTYPRRFIALMAIAAAAIAMATLLLTDWLKLSPCYLCVFQRFLMMTLTVIFVFSMLSGNGAPRRILMTLAGLIAVAGMGVSGFQSWQQWFPEAVGSCLGAEPNLIERFVEWLGQLSPQIFMVTGFCESKELMVLGLSLANYSFIAFAGFAIGIFLLLFRKRKALHDSAL